MDELRLGVIGATGRGGTFLRHAPDHGRIVAVCDASAENLARARERFPAGGGVREVGDYRELLAADLDGVFIATPDFLHEEMAVAFLEAGVGVFCEKPLAITTPGCDRILRAAYEHGTRLYVGHNMRHMPVITTMRDLIEAGEIGEVQTVWCRHFVGHGGDFYFKDWHADRRNTTGLLLQKGAHDIDVIHWLARGFSTRVNAFGSLMVYDRITDRQDHPSPRSRSRLGDELPWPPLSQQGMYPIIDVEDVSMVHLALDNGVLASYEQCHFTPDYWRNYTVIGTEGRLENFGDTGGATIKVWNQRRSGYRDDADRVVTAGSEDGTGHGGADGPMVAEFCEFLRSGIPTQTSPVAARQAVAAGCAATESLRDGGRPVDIEPVPADVDAYFGNGQVRAGGGTVAGSGHTG